MTHPRRGLRALLLTGLLLLIPASLQPPETQAAIPVIDGANLSQNIRTALAQIRAIEQRIEILTTQIDQYRWMLAQIEGLEDPTFREIGRLLANTVRIFDDGSEGAETQLSDNFSSVTLRLLGEPELTVTKTLDPSSNPAPGGLLLWTLVAANEGDREATDVFLTETVPQQTTFEPVTSPWEERWVSPRGQGYAPQRGKGLSRPGTGTTRRPAPAAAALATADDEPGRPPPRSRRGPRGRRTRPHASRLPHRHGRHGTGSPGHGPASRALSPRGQAASPSPTGPR